MNCIVKFKGNVYTLNEFRDLIMKEGITVLGDPSTSLARKIYARYAVANKEDSLMEVMAKTEAKRIINTEGEKSPKYEKALQLIESENPSADLINYFIYPSGKFNDYLVQSQIHTNTYSGTSITGIAANSSKEMGYHFEMAPITSIIDNFSGKIYSGTEEIDNLCFSMGVGSKSVLDLMDKYPQFSVYERELPQLKPSAWLSIDNHTFKTLSRNEVDVKTGATKLDTLNNRPFSIFETYDMIVNLAIDNVKEQKLFVMGITNANANSYLSAVSLGIPIDIITTLFNMPAVKAASKGRRVNTENVYKEYNISVVELSKIIERYVSKEDLAKVKKSLSNLEEAPDSKIQSGLRKIIKDYVRLDSDMMRKIIEADPSISQTEYDFLNIAALAILDKLISLGEEYFAYSQVFSLLRSNPNKMASIQYLDEVILKYNTFTTFEGADDTSGKRKELINSAKTDVEKIIISEDAKYKLLTSPEEKKKFLEEAIDKLFSNKTIVSKDIEDKINRTFTNMLIRRKMVKINSSSNASNFSNTSVLNIPHVYEAFTQLKFLRRIIESSFVLHHPAIQEFSKEVFEELGIFASYNKYQQISDISLDFIRYITSGMQIDLFGDKVDLSNNTFNGLNTFNTSGYGKSTTLTGPEAWCQNFLKDLPNKLRKIENNSFVEYLEIRTRYNGMSTLSIVADKIRDTVVREKIKQGFLDLPKELQLDVFKYAALTGGLFYGKTTLSLVIPVRFIARYSQIFSDRLDTLFKDKDATQVNYTLQRLKDSFILQFVKNHSSDLPFIRGLSPEDKGTKEYYRQDGSKGSYKLYRGSDTLSNGKTVYYDLKYVSSDDTVYPRFIKRFGNESYIKLNTNTPGVTYYRQLTSKSIHSFYNYQDNHLVNPIDLSVIEDGTKNIVGSFMIEGNILKDFSTNYEVGQELYAFDLTSSIPDKFSVYTIERKLADGSYIVKSTNKIISGTKSNLELFEEFPYLTTERYPTVIISNSIEETIAKVAKTKNLRAIIPSTVTAVSAGAIRLNVDNIEDTIQMLKNLPKTGSYILDRNILKGIENTADRKKVAEVLAEKTGYVDESIKAGFSRKDIVDKLSTFNLSLFMSTLNKLQNSWYKINSDVEQLKISLNTNKRKPSKGDFIVLTKFKGESDIVAYVRDVNGKDLVLNEIPNELASLLNSNNMEEVEFDNFLKENIKC